MVLANILLFHIICVFHLPLSLTTRIAVNGGFQSVMDLEVRLSLTGMPARLSLKGMRVTRFILIVKDSQVCYNIISKMPSLR